MQLERLCRVDLRYEADGAYVTLDGTEGGSWGAGSGVFAGERLQGTFRFANRARLRSDGTLLPRIDGALAVEEATVLVHMEGLVVGGRQRFAVTFESGDPGLAWLNTELGLYDGAVDHETGVVTGSLYLIA